MDTRIVFDFLPPILGALWDNADRLSNVDNFHAAVICGYKLYIVRPNCVSLSVVVTHNGAVINALDVPDETEEDGDETWMDMEDTMYERNDELRLAMADFLAIALQEGDNDGTNILEAYGYEAVDEILDGFLKELSDNYGFHIYRPMIVTEKESGCEVFTEFPYDEYDIDGEDEPDEEDETETEE